jgi:predicted phage-related endonuclease
VVPSVQLPEDAEQWLTEYDAALARFEAAKTDLDAFKNYFRMETGDAGAGYLGDDKVVSYPEVKSSRVSVEALKRDYPDVAEKVTEVSRYRRMTIRVPKRLKKADA